MRIFGWLRCAPKPKRLELRLLSYSDANKLIRETNGAWTIVKEEDGNRIIGRVFLERLETQNKEVP